jgi:YD repeat-containing protein
MIPRRRSVAAISVRCLSLLLCFALIFSTTPVAFSGKQSSPSPASNVLRTPGPPSPNLPNLDQIRLTQHKLPKMPAPKPSKGCGYKDQACKRDKEKKAANQPAPAPDNLIPSATGDLGRMLASAASSALTQPADFANGMDWFDWKRSPVETLVRSLRPALYDSPVGVTPRAARHALTGSVSFSPLMPPPPTDLLTARLDPRNRVGTAGEDLLSGNFNWSLPLVSLPGRAGLDLNLSLSYNSLVWIRDSNQITFEPDYYPSLTPGFRVGFPEIEGPSYNTAAQVEVYLAVLPSGRRVELRKIATNKYEAADSSHLHLTVEPAPQIMTLRATDGTQLKYTVQSDGWYHCSQIKDRNGNFITVAYTSLGSTGFVGIDTITDTLNRVIKFNYDGYYHLLSITQTWGGQTHTWASFDYSDLTIQANFSDPSYPISYINGPANNDVIPVLTRVITDDGARHVFVYNSYGQVNALWRYGAEDNQRAASVYNYNLPAGGLTDCPRFGSRQDWAYEWLGTSPSDPNSWVFTTFAFDPSGGGAWGTATTPDGTLHKEWFATSGWQRGLTTGTETWAAGVKQRWTDVTWAHSGTATVQKNPRVVETNVYDEAGNRRRTTIVYLSYSGIILPNTVYEYAADGQTVLRSTQTQYFNYLSQRIIGLPVVQFLSDGSGALAAKVEYIYDSTDTGFLQNLSPAPIQHDTANYGTGFTARGNLTKVRRYDVSAGTYLETKTGYNITGSAIFTRDALNHQTSLSYADAFADGINRNTYAYPTMVTDADNFSSMSKYHYDFGAVSETVDPKGARITRAYDAARRVEQITNTINGAYTKFSYANSHYYMQSWTTITNTSADLNTKLWTITVFDGANRVRATVRSHPSGTGTAQNPAGYSSVYNVYDQMGRLAQQSNPTEINSNWVPAGDDLYLPGPPAQGGYVWSQQAYDWRGRPTVSTNQDGTTRQIAYGGCGCAGGEAVTLTDEAGRKQKVTHDVLGRVAKTEVLKLQRFPLACSG